MPPPTGRATPRAACGAGETGQPAGHHAGLNGVGQLLDGPDAGRLGDRVDHARLPAAAGSSAGADFGSVDPERSARGEVGRSGCLRVAWTVNPSLWTA